MAGDPQPETELCRLEVDGAVANVTLDRTDAFNALNPQLISDISEILEWTSRRSVGTTGELRSPDVNIASFIRRWKKKNQVYNSTAVKKLMYLPLVRIMTNFFLVRMGQKD